MKNRLRDSVELFGVFFIIGLLNFGGGYSVLPFFKQEAVEKRKWIKNEELLDYFVISQCLPGVIAVNAATLVGYKVQRSLGAVFSTLGMILPAFISILLVAILFMNFMHLKIVHDILLGINVAVLLMIFEAVLNFAKKGIVDKASFCIFGLAFIACFFISPAIIIFSAGLFGFAVKKIRGEIQ